MAGEAADWDMIDRWGRSYLVGVFNGEIALIPIGVWRHIPCDCRLPQRASADFGLQRSTLLNGVTPHNAAGGPRLWLDQFHKPPVTHKWVSTALRAKAWKSLNCQPFQRKNGAPHAIMRPAGRDKVDRSAHRRSQCINDWQRNMA